MTYARIVRYGRKTPSTPLPLYLAERKRLALNTEGWRDLMQSVGYTVVIKARKGGKKQACPLINPSQEDAEKLQAL